MYRVSEALQLILGESTEIWDGNIICIKAGPEQILRSNKSHGFLGGYGFTLVRSGSLKILYNNKEFTLQRNDLYTYSPGHFITVTEASKDYCGYSLIADENYTLDLPIVHEAIRASYFSLVELREPNISLSEDDAFHLQELMQLAIRYQHSSQPLHYESLKMIYGIFLSELAAIQEKSISSHRFSKRVEELFVRFQQLVSKHFIEHHDIGFYASNLNITTTYLSRTIRQVSGGHTVVDWINQLLAMEASWLLQTTSLTVAQISDRLNFAETTTFARFFKRMRGMTPKEYRINKKF